MNLLSRLVDRGLNGIRRWLETGRRSPGLLRPPVNVSQTVGAVTVEFDDPGHGRDGLVLEVGPQRFEIAGGRPSTPLGRLRTPFDCCVDLPGAVDADQVKATLENGVLVVEMINAAWARATPGGRPSAKRQSR